MSKSFASASNASSLSALTNLNLIKSTTAASTIIGGTMLSVMALAMNSHALPQDGVVVGGSADIVNTSATQLDITQHSNKAILEWSSFNIGANEATNFHQPSPSAVALNRIGDQNPSQILGKLTANGQVMLVNPNGIFFGQSAQVDVAGLVATTADITNQDFMDGNYAFTIAGNPGAQIINEGNVTINGGGFAAFVSPFVRNNGVINARLGKVTLAGTDVFTLDLYGDNLISIALDRKVADRVLVEQAGLIEATGGVVTLTAGAAKGLVNSLINLDGIISAESISSSDGKVVLSGAGNINIAGKLNVSGQDTADAGSVVVKAKGQTTFTGEALAEGGANGGNGGFIELSGDELELAGSASVAAANGSAGSVLLDPTVFTIDNDAATSIEGMLAGGGLVSVAASKTINLDADIDTTPQNSIATLEFADQDLNGKLTVNLHGTISLGNNQSLIGDASTVNVLTDAASVQNAIDVASVNGATINVYPGTYNESSLNHSESVGLLFNKDSIILRGVTASGSVINDASATEATINLIGSGTEAESMLVSGDNAQLRGLHFDMNPANTGATIRVTGNNATLIYNKVEGPTGGLGQHKSGITIDGVDGDVVKFNINNNIVNDGGISIINGVGLAGGSAGQRKIVNNTISSSASNRAAVRLLGNLADYNWSNAGVGQVSISGNTFVNYTSPIAFHGADVATHNWKTIISSNTFLSSAVGLIEGYGSNLYAEDIVDLNGKNLTETRQLGTSLYNALADAVANDTIYLSKNTFNLGSSTLNLNIEKLRLQGSSEFGTVIDASGISGYGLLVNADGTQLMDFTLQGPAADIDTAYGIKIQPDTGVITDEIKNVQVNRVTVQGSGRAEIDVHAGNNIKLYNVTVDGQSTNGAGIQVTDSTKVNIKNVTTRDNLWGGIALYAGGGYYTPGTTKVSITGTNSYGEDNPLYIEVANGYDVTNIYVPDFNFIVRNDTYRAGAENFTHFQQSEQQAIDFALGLGTDADSTVQTVAHTTGPNLSTIQNHFIVGHNTGDTAAMSIQKAIDESLTGGLVEVRAGTYNENVVVDKLVDIIGSGKGNNAAVDTIVIGTASNTPTFNLQTGGTNADNMVISKMNISGGNGDGILISGGNGFTNLTNLNVSGNTGVGINLDSSTALSGVGINSVTFNNNNVGFGIASSSADVDGITVTNSSFAGNSTSAISVLGNGNQNGRDNLAFTNITIGDSGVTDALFTGVNNLSLTNTTFTGTGAYYGLFISGSDSINSSARPLGNVTLTNVDFDGTNDVHLRIADSTDVSGVSFTNTNFNGTGDIALSLGNITDPVEFNGEGITFADTNGVANLEIDSSNTTLMNFGLTSFTGATSETDVLNRIKLEAPVNIQGLIIPTFLNGQLVTRETNRILAGLDALASVGSIGGNVDIFGLIQPAAGPEGEAGNNAYSTLSPSLLALVQYFINTGYIVDEEDAINALLSLAALQQSGPTETTTE